MSADNNTHADNIAADKLDASDAIVERFDIVRASIEDLALLTDKLDNQPHDQARVNLLIQCTKALQLQNEKIYDLLVEMNDFFGAKN